MLVFTGNAMLHPIPANGREYTVPFPTKLGVYAGIY
jgi:hypothetical protein